ncbi:transposase [Candidatus Magnetomorum sp. HK-1]|nr:transposase [Candidatus Magnetomorum sp. HK-1]
MARIARIVSPGMPHHVTQRGNRRQKTFFNDDDYRFYLTLMSEWCNVHDVDIWAYCLMPNHIHLIAVPKKKDSLRLAIGEAHRRYTRRINFREDWRGHLWQGRFSSFIMDENHLLACTRYIEMNPVNAGLVKKPEDWPWSSASPHINWENDDLVNVSPLLNRVRENWTEFLAKHLDETEIELFRKHERTGRPLGDEHFIEELESILNIPLKLQKAGRKKKE